MRPNIQQTMLQGHSRRRRRPIIIPIHEQPNVRITVGISLLISLFIAISIHSSLATAASADVTRNHPFVIRTLARHKSRNSNTLPTTRSKMLTDRNNIKSPLYQRYTSIRGGGDENENENESAPESEGEIEGNKSLEKRGGHIEMDAKLEADTDTDSDAKQANKDTNSSISQFGLWGTVRGAFEMNLEAKDELIHEGGREEQIIDNESDNGAGTDNENGNSLTETASCSSQVDSLESAEEPPSTSFTNPHTNEFGVECETSDSQKEVPDLVNQAGLEDSYRVQQPLDAAIQLEVESSGISSDEEVIANAASIPGNVDPNEESENDEEESGSTDSEYSADEDISKGLFKNQALGNIEEPSSIGFCRDPFSVTQQMLDELSESEEEQKESEPHKTIEEILREEWSMIPDTEGEDEGRENVITEEGTSNSELAAKPVVKNMTTQEREAMARDKERKRKRDERRERRKEERRIKRAERRAREEKERLEAQERERIRREERESDSSDTEQLQQQQEKEHDRTLTQSQDTNTIPQASNMQDDNFNSQQGQYVSSGLWITIDKFSSFGLSTSHEELRLSKKLHYIRKRAAYYTGMHGFLSGKARSRSIGIDGSDEEYKELNEEEIGKVRARIAAIQAARRRVAASSGQSAFTKTPTWRKPIENIINKRNQAEAAAAAAASAHANSNANPNPEGTTFIKNNSSSEQSKRPNDFEMPPMSAPSLMTEADRERVKEIDLLIQNGQKRIQELQVQKDELQKRPNPLYNYTKSPDVKDENGIMAPGGSTRIFNFPSDDLVGEYIEQLVTTGRLEMMNHTDLWKKKIKNKEDYDEEIGDDLFTPSGDARKLYENGRRNGNGINKGSWLLRQTLGAGGSLGEKIGDLVENAAYKGVCSVVMDILARSIAALHGVNVMKHSDIRLFVESALDLPPVSKSMFSGDDYAREAIGKAIRRGSNKKKKRRKKQTPYHYGSHSGDDAFVQRDAVVETLISHCQISAPLLKLFPHAWQRALLGNIITLIAAVVSDFCEGVQFQILGHQLAFSFKPITEADMIQHIGVGGFRFNHRRSKPEEFEAAVRATAVDISQSLGFLDRWHQRALGGDLLRAQIGNLIARVVLTLVDEVLHSARMDLWSAQVGGPRVVAGLEYRIEEEEPETFT